MPYPPVLNPQYFHWEPWPHVYRRGMPPATVTAFHRRSLGETAPAVPWQCWDTPGFKDCQSACYGKAQKTGVSADAQAALVEQCFRTDCVRPCEEKLAKTTAQQPPQKASALTLESIASSPMKVAAVALVLAVGATLMMPQERKTRSTR